MQKKRTCTILFEKYPSCKVQGLNIQLKTVEWIRKITGPRRSLLVFQKEGGNSSRTLKLETHRNKKVKKGLSFEHGIRQSINVET